MIHHVPPAPHQDCAKLPRRSAMHCQHRLAHPP
jgi:hypothetical protein